MTKDELRFLRGLMAGLLMILIRASNPNHSPIAQQQRQNAEQGLALIQRELDKKK